MLRQLYLPAHILICNNIYILLLPCTKIHTPMHEKPYANAWRSLIIHANHTYITNNDKATLLSTAELKQWNHVCVYPLLPIWDYLLLISRLLHTWYGCFYISYKQLRGTSREHHTLSDKNLLAKKLISICGTHAYLYVIYMTIKKYL